MPSEPPGDNRRTSRQRPVQRPAEPPRIPDGPPRLPDPLPPEPRQSRAPAPSQEMLAESRDRAVIKAGDLIRSDKGVYKIETLLGEGGMGKVFKAMDMKSGETVAIKFILKTTLAKMDSTLRTATIERFNREAELASSVKHPNVINTTDFGFHGDNAFIVMEYFPGEDLGQIYDKLAQEGERMSWEWLGPVLTKACEGIGAIHAINMMHRDLKLGNIMTSSKETEAGTMIRVKVVDFGLAKMMYDQGQTDEELTVAGTLVGTPAYMSPEQVQGKHCDHRADIYGLATIAYRLLIGEVPFPSDPERAKAAGGVDTAALVKKINNPPAPLRDVRPDISPEAEKVILRGLATDPEDRYYSAEQFKQAIQDSLTEKPQEPVRELSLPDFVAAVQKKKKRRSWGKRIVTTVVVLAALGAGGYFGYYKNQEWLKQKWKEFTSETAEKKKPPKVAKPKPVKKKGYVVTVKSRRQIQVFRTVKVKYRWKDVEFLGTTPLTTVLPPGKHRLRLRKRGWSPRIIKVSEKNAGCTYNYSRPYKGWTNCKKD